MSKTTGSQIVLPNQLIMVKPELFGYNPETSTTNVFQHAAGNPQEDHDQALIELDAYYQMYLKNRIDVIMLDTTGGKKTKVHEIKASDARPDEIFPNCVVTFPGSDIKHMGTVGRSGHVIDEKETYAFVMPMLEE